MRILLDSRDLIAVVERQRPITPQQADEYLRSNGHELVFTFTNIREFVAPLATGSEFLTVRPFLQALERLPHTYLKEVPIVAAEIQAAVRAFNSGTDFQIPLMYGDRWDQTLAPLSEGRRSTVEERLM